MRAPRRQKYPGGRWHLWARHMDWTLSTVVSNSYEWGDIINRYRTRYPVISARPIP